MPFRSGYVAIIGRPNSGKSTLVNSLVGRKVSIVTSKPQTTRNRIQGLLNLPDAQIVLLDTPGLHRGGSALDRRMTQEITEALDGIDVLSLVVDATQRFGRDDEAALRWTKRFDGPVFLLLNKIDRIEKPKLLPLMDFYSKQRDFAEIYPISGLKSRGLEELSRGWISRLPENPPFFPPDQYTDQPERFLAAEIIREKAIRATREEIPYAIAVFTENFEESDKLIRIRATLHVEREGQKGILIGKAGAMMKKIGSEARHELETLLGAKVFLELIVKVLPNWREDPAVIRRLDWRRQLEEMAEGAEDEGES